MLSDKSCHALCVTVCCSVLQCVAVCCNVIQCVTRQRGVVKYVAVRGSVVKCGKVQHSALQLLCLISHAMRCVWQCNAVCCSAMQCVAV